ncbi:transposase, Ptta/En/Spm [Artemisia annua]|uniref:Transposase, Ptta/En/Spm n=1 Tax=Artemisia annua TaxID=35608 RepID=A0A2U1MFT8_ARTAN|nr:transposase, Ptta/En/Spm [Artemisia annua]
MSIRDNNRQMSEHGVQRLHSETFAEWFQDHIEKLHMTGDQRITGELRALATNYKLNTETGVFNGSKLDFCCHSGLTGQNGPKLASFWDSVVECKFNLGLQWGIRCFDVSGIGMPSRKANRVSTRGRNNSQQAEDVTEVGSNQLNAAQGMASRRHNGVSTRGHNNSQQDEDDKFDLPPGSDDWILKSFGRKVKNWRARVKKDYYDPTLPFREQITFKPKRVLASQWKRLVKYWNKGKSKRLSEKNKANRAKKKMVQVTGKTSYAQVREKQKVILGREPTRKELFRACFSKDGNTQNEEAAEAIEQMEELTSQLSEHELDEPGPQDIYSKVMGNDKNGTAEMYGLGVRASDVWGVVPSRSARHRDKLQWKSTAERLSAELAQYKARDAQRQGSSDNDSHGPNVPHPSPQGLIANEPRPLRGFLALDVKSCWLLSSCFYVRFYCFGYSDLLMMLGEENIPMPPPVVNDTTDVINDNNVSAGGHVEPVSCASPATDANVIEPGLRSGNVLNESQVEKKSANVHVSGAETPQIVFIINQISLQYLTVNWCQSLKFSSNTEASLGTV